MFDHHLEESVRKAFHYAYNYRHEYVTLEHLLLALLSNSSALHALHAHDVDISALSNEVIAYLKETLPTTASLPKDKSEPTMAFQRVLQHATLRAQSSDKRLVSGADVLASFFEEGESHATYLLASQNVARSDIADYADQDAASRHFPDTNFDHDASSRVDESRPQRVTRKLPRDILPLFENLNKKVERGLLNPLIGREEELTRTIQILSRRSKNNPIYVGDAGVGKTAIVEGLARRIVRGEVPEAMKDTSIYALNLCNLLAGTRYRGDFEQRLKHMLAWLSEQPNTVLFIDEIHSIIGAGSTTGASTDASNLLKPALSSGALRCIGATTIREYRAIFEKDSALARRFQKIDVRELNVDETYDVLFGLKDIYGSFHKVKYSDKTLFAAAELAARYLHDRALPDKAIDVIDEAGAAVKLRRGAARDNGVIKVRDIERTVARMAQVPPQHVTSDDKSMLVNLESKLKRVIFNQDAAIEKVVAAIQLARAGLRDARKPVGSFLFSGPTGVGKTELAKQLAAHLDTPLLRYDMSEYMERHTVSRLIGAPPGYVGHDQGGLLSNDVLKNPHAVVLLDEIEKAHYDIFNVLLQVMDNAILTDGNGRKVDFANIVLIMTSNIGAAEMEKNGMGFLPQSGARHAGEEMKRIFSPEFRNRLDAAVVFNPLNDAMIDAVVAACIDTVGERLRRKNIRLKLDRKAKRYLAENGSDKTMGVRPMQRLVEERITKPLLDAILFGDLQKGGVANFTVQGERLTFTCACASASTTKAPTKASKKRSARKAPKKSSAKA